MSNFNRSSLLSGASSRFAKRLSHKAIWGSARICFLGSVLDKNRLGIAMIPGFAARESAKNQSSTLANPNGKLKIVFFSGHPPGISPPVPPFLLPSPLPASPAGGGGGVGGGGWIFGGSPNRTLKTTFY